MCNIKKNYLHQHICTTLLTQGDGASGNLLLLLNVTAAHAQLKRIKTFFPFFKQETAYRTLQCRVDVHAGS